MAIDFETEYDSDPSGGVGVVRCASCAAEGNPVEFGRLTPPGRFERIWRIDWARLPCGTERELHRTVSTPQFQRPAEFIVPREGQTSTRPPRAEADGARANRHAQAPQT